MQLGRLGVKDCACRPNGKSGKSHGSFGSSLESGAFKMRRLEIDFSLKVEAGPAKCPGWVGSMGSTVEDGKDGSSYRPLAWANEFEGFSPALQILPSSSPYWNGSGGSTLQVMGAPEAIDVKVSIARAWQIPQAEAIGVNWSLNGADFRSFAAGSTLKGPACSRGRKGRRARPGVASTRGQPDCLAGGQRKAS